MKAWQRRWLIGIVTFFFIHLIRDLMQDFGIHNLLSDTLVKQDLSKTPTWYWKVFNVYFIESLGIFLAWYSLKMKKFELTGFMTIFLAVFFISVWLFYWVFL